MTNTIQINCEQRFITHKDKDFIGVSGENDVETLKIVLDEEKIIENIKPYLEIEFPDNTKGSINMNKVSDTEAEIKVKNSLLKQEGCLKLEFVLVSKDTTVFKSEIFKLKVLEAINATETLEEDYPNVFQDIEEMKKDIEKLKENGGADLTEILKDINNLKVSEEEQNKEIIKAKEEQNKQKNDILANTNKITLLETQSGSKINLNINTSNYIMTLELLNSKNEVVSSKSIDFPLESMVVNGRFENNNIILTLQNGNEVSFSVASLVNGLVNQETFENCIEEIKEDISKIKKIETNKKILINDNTNNIEGEYYNMNGELKPLNIVGRTILLDIRGYSKLYINCEKSATNDKDHIICFFDINKNFLSSIKKLYMGEAVVSIPDNACYVSVAYYLINKDTFYVKASYPILQDKNEKFIGKKMNCLGDSITYGYIPDNGNQMDNPYPEILRNNLELAECRNYGISGSTLTTGNQSMTTRYLEMDNDADIVSVFGGTNDFGTNQSLGTLGDTTNATIYGALDVLCNGLIEKYPEAFIFFITPLRRADKVGRNEKEYTLEDVANAIKKVCYKYSIPVLDLYSIGGFYIDNDTFRAIYNGEDKLHPNQKFVEEKLTQIIEKFIRSYGNSSYASQNEQINDVSVKRKNDIRKFFDLEGGAIHVENWGSCYYYKIGSKVTVHIGVRMPTINRTKIFTLPEGYRPPGTIPIWGGGADGAKPDQSFCEIFGNTLGADGEIYVKCPSKLGLFLVEYDVFESESAVAVSNNVEIDEMEEN